MVADGTGMARSWPTMHRGKERTQGAYRRPPRVRRPLQRAAGRDGPLHGQHDGRQLPRRDRAAHRPLGSRPPGRRRDGPARRRLSRPRAAGPPRLVRGRAGRCGVAPRRWLHRCRLARADAAGARPRAGDRDEVAGGGASRVRPGAKRRRTSDVAPGRWPRQRGAAHVAGAAPRVPLGLRRRHLRAG